MSEDDIKVLREAQSALWQYCSDLKFPPTGDSIDRRAARADRAATDLTALIERFSQ